MSYRAKDGGEWHPSRGMTESRWLLLPALAAVVACGSSAPSSSGASSASSNVEQSILGGIVAARNTECASVGSAVVHYLVTGDNGGDPRLDQALATERSRILGQPQDARNGLIRADADQSVQNCDAQVDQQNAQAAAAAASASSSSASSASSFSSESRVFDNQQRTCAAVKGRVESRYGFPSNCYSTVKGNPSGQPGSDCANSSVSFNSDGTLRRADLEDSNLFYPGCFPKADTVPNDVAN